LDPGKREEKIAGTMSLGSSDHKLKASLLGTGWEFQLLSIVVYVTVIA